MPIEIIRSDNPRPLANYNEAVRFGNMVFAAGQLSEIDLSGNRITQLPAMLYPTATNLSWPASPPQVTESHILSAADARLVHVIPSVLVITRLPVPV